MTHLTWDIWRHSAARTSRSVLRPENVKKLRKNVVWSALGAITLVNPHQRCGYSDSPFARIYFFYTAGSRNRFEGMEPVCTHTKKQKTISKGYLFLMEKYKKNMLCACYIGILNGDVVFWRPQAPNTCISKNSKPQNGFADHPSPIFEAAHPFSRHLVPTGAKYLEKKAQQI